MITIHTIEDKLKGLDKKVLFTGVAVMVLAVIAGIGYRILGKQGGTGAPAAGASIAVPVVMVEPRLIESVVTAAGALNSKNSSALSGKVMGRVVELNVHEGDQVAEGRLLMKIDSGEITMYSGNYDFYERERGIRDANREAAYARQQAMLAKEQRFIDRFAAHAAKAAQVQSRVKALDKIEKVELPKRRVVVKFDFREPPRSGDQVAVIEGLSKSYGKRGVKFVWVYPNPTDSPAAKLEFHKKSPLEGRMVDDQGARVAQLLEGDLQQGREPAQRGVALVGIALELARDER